HTDGVKRIAVEQDMNQRPVQEGCSDKPVPIALDYRILLVRAPTDHLIVEIGRDQGGDVDNSKNGEQPERDPGPHGRYPQPRAHSGGGSGDNYAAEWSG